MTYIFISHPFKVNTTTKIKPHSLTSGQKIRLLVHVEDRKLQYIQNIFLFVVSFISRGWRSHISVMLLCWRATCDVWRVHSDSTPWPIHSSSGDTYTLLCLWCPLSNFMHIYLNLRLNLHSVPLTVKLNAVGGRSHIFFFPQLSLRTAIKMTAERVRNWQVEMVTDKDIAGGKESDTKTLGHWDAGGRMLCAPSGCHLSVFFLSAFVTKGNKCRVGPCSMNLCQHVQVITGHYVRRRRQSK